MCQLGPSPRQALDAEASALTPLFRAPSGWAPDKLLKSLKWLGFPAEVPDLASIAMAARARVAIYENLKPRRLAGLRESSSISCIAEPPRLRGSCFAPWRVGSSNFLFTLEAAVLQVHGIRDPQDP